VSDTHRLSALLISDSCSHRPRYHLSLFFVVPGRVFVSHVRRSARAVRALDVTDHTPTVDQSSSPPDPITDITKSSHHSTIAALVYDKT
jgi:hypothetical protein